MVLDEVVKQCLDPLQVAFEGEVDEEDLEVLPVGDHVVVEELLAGVVALPLLDHLEQGVIICRIAPQIKRQIDYIMLSGLAFD